MRDVRGNVNVEPSSLQVRATISSPSTSCGGTSPTPGCQTINPYTWSCGHPSVDSGIGLCSATLPTSWFSLNGKAVVSVDVSYGGVTAASHVAETELRVIGKPPWWNSLDTVLSNDGMFATMPASPKYAGETFTLSVYARATTYPLVTWGIKISLDTTKLTYVSGAGSALFNPAVMDIPASGSPIGIVAVGIKASTKTYQVQGGAVAVFTATLRINSGIAPGAHRGAVSLFVDEMINQGSLAWRAGLNGIILNPSQHVSLYDQAPTSSSPKGCPDLTFGSSTVGSCPVGWQCTGSAMVSACYPKSWTCHATGNYLSVAGNTQTGSATSTLFPLPEGTKAMRYRHAGGADFPSRLLLIDKAMDGAEEPLCSLTRGYDDNVLSRPRSSLHCDLSLGDFSGSDYGGRVAYLRAEHTVSGQSWSRLLLDEIEFLDASGHVLQMSDAHCNGTTALPYSGHFVILQPKLIAFFAWLPESSVLLNLSPLLGGRSMRHMSAEAVYDRYSMSNSAVSSSSLRCNSTSAALTISYIAGYGCTISASARNAYGDDRANVYVSTTTLDAVRVPVYVWHLSKLPSTSLILPLNVSKAFLTWFARHHRQHHHLCNLLSFLADLIMGGRFLNHRHLRSITTRPMHRSFPLPLPLPLTRGCPT